MTKNLTNLAYKTIQYNFHKLLKSFSTEKRPIPTINIHTDNTIKMQHKLFRMLTQTVQTVSTIRNAKTLSSEPYNTTSINITQSFSDTNKTYTNNQHPTIQQNLYKITKFIQNPNSHTTSSQENSSNNPLPPEC